MRIDGGDARSCIEPRQEHHGRSGHQHGVDTLVQPESVVEGQGAEDRGRAVKTQPLRRAVVIIRQISGRKHDTFALPVVALVSNSIARSVATTSTGSTTGWDAVVRAGSDRIVPSVPPESIDMNDISELGIALPSRGANSIDVEITKARLQVSTA